MRCFAGIEGLQSFDFNNESLKIETDDAIVIVYSFMASLKKTFYQNINI